jgi:hypothetical protein
MISLMAKNTITSATLARNSSAGPKPINIAPTPVLEAFVGATRRESERVMSPADAGWAAKSVEERRNATIYDRRRAVEIEAENLTLACRTAAPW